MLLPVLLCVLLACDEGGAQRTADPSRGALYRLERIDVDTMLNNNRIMTNYVKCFVGKGACSPEARDFRKMIPRLTATACGDCTPNQRRIIKKVFLFMYTQRNADWKLLQELFDPKHKFEKKICEFMGVAKSEKTTEKTTTAKTTTAKPS